MRVAIIGAGFTGLACALRIAKNGHQVIVYESLESAGGLAVGFKTKGWKWQLEKHYHHLFVDDTAIIKLAEEINHKILFVRPKTSTFYQNSIYQLDSAISLLKFTPLSFLNRIRTGIVLFYLKLTPFWQSLEKASTKDFITKWMGHQSWQVLWMSLMYKKFNKYHRLIAASWFWARIKKRSAVLGYPEGGFGNLADFVVKQIKKEGGEVHFNVTVEKIRQSDKQILLKFGNKSEKFDKVVCTLPTPLFIKITEGLTASYVKKFKGSKGLGAVNVLLSLKRRFLEDGTYWLNINDIDIPFLAVVEHTNFIKNKFYGGEVMVYVGNYLETSHRFFQKTPEELVDSFSPYLKKINKDFKKSWIKKAWAFKANFAQPVVGKNYSNTIPPLETSISNLYLANIQQVYPWDRGTNYAVELGTKIADKIIKDDK